MQVITKLAELRQQIRELRQQGKTIAMVATMGNLHAGHIALIHQAKTLADIVIATIFVNPLQFGSGEDLEKYPKTLSADKEQLTNAGCHLLFAPTDSEVYPHGRDNQTIVEVPATSNLYCGTSRPGHFQGVATVVCKLYSMIQPDIAVFGEKDYQQLHIIRQMTQDLSIAVEVIGSPTKRNAGGLALSSRNGYLTADERSRATALYKALQSTKHQLKLGFSDFPLLCEQAQTQLEEAGFKRDYFVIANANTLMLAQPGDIKLVILAAAYMGAARLIDNQVVSL
ncbi:MAG: pantoate--beta-alanine ligase [Osedax symbiont Rs1]|nr:MAG: pantoate--beta-alanine ligase [Osedax symbiont Rs1]